MKILSVLPFPEVVQDPEGVYPAASAFTVSRHGGAVCVDFTRPADPSAEYYEIMEALRLVGCSHQEAQDFIKIISRKR